MGANTEIREAMRQALHKRGWTQEQLASELGITKSAVTQLLNGHYGKIPQSLLNALEALDLELVAQEVRPKK